MVTVSNATPRPPHLVDSSLGNGPEEVLHVRVSPEGGPPPYISHQRCEGLRDGRAGGADPGEAGRCPSCPVKTLVPGLSPASQEAHKCPEDALP